MNSNKLVLKSLTVLIILYLILIPFGIIKNRFSSTDVVIIIVVLVFNSGLIDRLDKLEYKDGSLSIEISEMKKQQQTQIAKIAANTDIIQRLTNAKKVVIDDDKAKKEFYQNLVTPSELEQLKKLAGGSTYPTTQNLQTLKEELRRLRTLGLIETLPNQEITTIQDVSSVRDHVKVSERGTEFIQLIENVDTKSIPSDKV